MTKPKAVSVMGIPYRIEYAPELRDDKGEELFADTDGPGRLIRVSNKQNDTADKFEGTLFHELVHAVFHVTGISEILGDKKEEAVVLALEHGLAPLYKRKFR